MDSFPFGELFLFALAVAVIFGIVYVTRGFWAWYFKINDLIENQEQTNLLLKMLLNFQMTGKAYNLDDAVIYEDLKTGKIMETSTVGWETFIAENPKKRKEFRRIN